MRSFTIFLSVVATLAFWPIGTLVYYFHELQSPTFERPFHGVTYQRAFRSQPRNYTFHLVTVDLAAEGVEFIVTPGMPDGAALARTTSDFAEEFGVQIALNGSLFRPAHTKHPFDFFPGRGDVVDIAGLSMANGVRYSDAADGWPVLCVAGRTEVSISDRDCPRGTREAIAGVGIILKDGEPVRPGSPGTGVELHPRSAVAVSRDGTRLILLVVDGRQALYSEGVTAFELAELLREFGGYNGIEMDGGGSASIVLNRDGSAEVLNSPIHTGIPFRERPVGNHIGIRAKPATRARF